MNTESFFCKNYTNKKQIYQIIHQAYQTVTQFKGSANHKQITIPALTLTNLSQEHLFFSCDYQPDLYLSAGMELALTFHVQLENSMLPCECTVSIVTFTQKGDKLFIVAMFPYSISFMQRREQIRYPIKEENFSYYSVLFTNTQVINETEWQPIDNNAVHYNEISMGGVSLYIDTTDLTNLPTNKSILILKCKFPHQQPVTPLKKENSNFIIVARISRLTKKGSQILLRAKFSHWCYNVANNKKWNIVQHAGIAQLLPYIAPPSA